MYFFSYTSREAEAGEAGARQAGAIKGRTRKGAKKTGARGAEDGEVEARGTRSGRKSGTTKGQTIPDQKRQSGETAKAHAKEATYRASTSFELIYIIYVWANPTAPGGF